MTSKDKAGILPIGAVGIGGGGVGGGGADLALALAFALAAGAASLPMFRPVRQPILAHLQWFAHRSSLQRGSCLQRPLIAAGFFPTPRSQGSPKYGVQEYGPGIASNY